MARPGQLTAFEKRTGLSPDRRERDIVVNNETFAAAAKTQHLYLSGWIEDKRPKVDNVLTDISDNINLDET
ncbi:hypothetical protein NIM86_06320 [Notoacmeibacter sp. MSK16QG-6]|nr:hypothetical protein [Notoacmeibacter sp. MSK16QG-6]